MKSDSGSMIRYSHYRILVGTAVLFCLAAIFLKRMDGHFSQSLGGLKKAYKMDRSLALHKDKYTEAYREILSVIEPPAAKPLELSSWIQRTQDQLKANQLSLKEIKPVYEEGGNDTHLSLIVESRIGGLIGFFHQLSRSDDYVYVDEFSAAPVFDNAESVEVQITLSQIKG